MTIPQNAALFKSTDLFRIRNFNLLWSAQVFSDFSDSITNLAVMLLINHITGSVTAMATMSIFLALPRLVIGLASGVFVDRLDRKRIMVYSNLLRAALVLLFLLVDSPGRMWLLFLIGFLQGSIMTFFTPSRSALLPNLVPTAALLPANSITQTTQVVCAVAGSAAAGALVGLTDLYWPVFALSAAAYLVSFLLIAVIRCNTVPRKVVHETFSLRLVLQNLVRGLRITFGHRLLAGAIVALAITNLGIGAVNVLMVPLMVNTLKIPETWFGLTSGGETTGMLISGLLITALAARFKPPVLIVAGLLGLGLATGAVSLVGNVYQVIIALFLAGLSIPPITASVMTIIQTRVPDEMRGRTSAANNALMTGAQLISMAAAGLLADALGVKVVFLLSGAIVMLAGIVAAFIFRSKTAAPPPVAQD